VGRLQIHDRLQIHGRLQFLQASGTPNEVLCGVPQVVTQEEDSIQRRINELEFVNGMIAKFLSH
jgi:hypothetical protein